MSKLQIWTKTITTTLNQPVVSVIDHLPKPQPRIRALKKGPPEFVVGNYNRFNPYYRKALKSLRAELVDIQYSDKLKLHVGLYEIERQYGQNEYFMWVWHENTMHEVEQRFVQEPSGFRELDRTATRINNPWLY